ncbi:O-succinylhomoserine sulfhydrylase [Rhodoligotrophos defluvii]|uniref:O-succinylhomoserine sulfhydrylase n=1 Tax=Rhodoligotrophos defluvii TaxID=2561934 RepID=UPI0010C9AD92|nr:O-succinylhomoserine sulfhydrylase [Rhodoligotrophos defluvii]
MSDKPDSNPAARWGEATRLVRGGTDRSPHGETAEALYLNSGFVYPDAETAAARFAGEAEGYVYARYGNPTVTMFEERLRLIEGAEACYATASGMAAVFGALACQVKAGDHVVASRALFGSCYQIITTILPRFGVDYTLVDGADLDQWARAFKPNTRCVFLETPSNPGLEVIDLAAVTEIAHGHGARVVVDNVFATPILQKPLAFGADIVVYSGTKHIDGQGRCLGGAVLSTRQFKEEELKPFLRHTGPALSPFNAWVLLKGLETLKLRVMAQCSAAERIARALAQAPGVERVLYPGLPSHPQHELAMRQMTAGGTLVSFFVTGGRERAFSMLRRLKLIDISNNLGDAKSLITHPASTTHRNIGEEARATMGITEGMLRLSVGLEEPEDLIQDLRAALSD